MKCDYCGAFMPYPESAPTYSESYKELRKEIGKLEYENGILVTDKKRVEDWLISCRESFDRIQSSEKDYKRQKKIWKGAAIFMLASNLLWLFMLAAFIG